MKVLVGTSQGKVSVACEEVVDVPEGENGTEVNVTVIVVADTLQECLPLLIARFGQMQMDVIDGLRKLGVSITMEHGEKELPS